MEAVEESSCQLCFHRPSEPALYGPGHPAQGILPTAVTTRRGLPVTVTAQVESYPGSGAKKPPVSHTTENLTLKIDLLGGKKPGRRLPLLQGEEAEN